MLPMPGSPSSSWALYRSRLRSPFAGADPRVYAAFWLFGLINNVLYVIILSAALDLVGPTIPKSVVLLADVLPSFLTKLVAPYFIQNVAYQTRVVAFVALSVGGMLLIALTSTLRDGGTVAVKMLGVTLASLSSGGGELSFLALTHYYGPFSLAAWGSGTGGAGLVGAGLYALLTTSLGVGSTTTLFLSAFLPIVMLFSFFVILPRKILKSKKEEGRYESVPQYVEEEVEEGEEEEGFEGEALFGREISRASSTMSHGNTWTSFQANLLRARSLFIPYMLPLLLVYIAEYTINQGVAPTLLFPLQSSPFKHYRAFYPTYNAIYQIGVFVSRSSTPFLRIRNLVLPTLLQVINLIVLTFQALLFFDLGFRAVCAIMLWEGLLGGLVYVNTFAEITDNVKKEDREFSLGATSVSDSGGICLAGLLGMFMEVAICNWQVIHGRDWCKKL